MNTRNTFSYKPEEHEAEKASNSYLMSLVVLIFGLPLPIVNLIASIIFYFANQKESHFVRWHCTQALISQFSLFIINTCGFWWTIFIVFGTEKVSTIYLTYIITIIIFNIIEFAATIFTAIQTRKGFHIEWWIYGSLTDLACKPHKVNTSQNIVSNNK